MDGIRDIELYGKSPCSAVVSVYKGSISCVFCEPPEEQRVVGVMERQDTEFLHSYPITWGQMPRFSQLVAEIRATPGKPLDKIEALDREFL